MIKLLLATVLWAADGDSLRLETINGKQFIIHQIEAKETLYSISRRYGVTVTSIIESNNAAEASLAIGQLLKIPYVPKSKSKPNESVSVPVAKSVNAMHAVASKETLYSIAKQYSISVDQLKQWNNLTGDELKLGQQLLVVQPKSSTSSVPTPISTESITPKSASAIHTVVAKETLFSIAKQYGVAVDQLKQWNNLTSNELKLNQQLVVVQPKYSSTSTTQASSGGTVTSSTSLSSTTPVSSSVPIKISEKVLGADEVREEGNCDLMPNTESSRKYLAFHRTAKIGSVLKVRNLQSNREVFVRVLGPMPADASSEIAIRISTAAMNRLEAADGKCRVEITYYQ